MIRVAQLRSSRIDFPFGYSIRVELKTEAELVALCVAAGETEDVEAEGWWESSERAVYMNVELDEDRYAEVLSHEMIHAVADFELWVRDCYVVAERGQEVAYR